MVKATLTEEQALKGFGEGLDCSQAVFGEIAPQLGLDRDLALQIADGFGGGMWQGEVCGCVIGGLMAIGLKYGQGKNDQEMKKICQAKGAEFRAKFAEVYGSCLCREMLGYNISIPEEAAKIMEENKFGTVCCKAAVTACKILEEIL